MQLDHLDTLLAVAEEGTFDAAARVLSITPSAVSQRVKAAEESVGQVLVQRTNPVQMTSAGEIFLRYARQLKLLEQEALRDVEAAVRIGGVDTVAIAVNADSLATWFLHALAEIADRADVAFEIHREDQERTTSLLRSGMVLAAVTSTAEPVQGCSSEPIGFMRYRAVCAPKFAARWSGHDVGNTWLESAPMIMFDRNDQLQTGLLRSLGHPSQGPRHLIPTSGDFARAINAGLGWGMLPEQQCASLVADGTLLDVAPGRHVDVALFWQRWSLRSHLLDQITDVVRTVARRELRSAHPTSHVDQPAEGQR